MDEFDAAQRLERAGEWAKNGLLLVMESILVDMVSFAKEQGPWADRTTNLRQSITYKKPEILDDGSIRGVVFAGMEYAIYVEFRQGYWVLSGAVDEYRGKLGSLIRDRMRQFAGGVSL